MSKLSGRPARGLVGLVLVSALFAPVALLSSPSATAAGKSDLQVVGLSAADRTVQRGATFVAADTTKNVSGRRSVRSVTRYYLSRDRLRQKADRVLGQRGVPGLAAGQNSVRRPTLRVSATTPVGSWYVLACADATRKVAESREGNNCRATTRSIRVTAAPTPPGRWPQVPDPLNVAYTVDTPRRLSATVYSFMETTLEVTGADGTTYRLWIPANALRGGDIEVSLTPVLTIDGLPMASAWAAEILPHGLLLDKPAVLTITPPVPIPLTDQTGLLFHEDGKDFQLMPLQPGAPLSLELLHFSTPGVGAATPAQRSAIAGRSPLRPEAQFTNALTEYLLPERQRQLSGLPDDPAHFEGTKTTAEEYFTEVVEPKVKAAITDDSIALEAIALGLLYLRQMDLLGIGNDARALEMHARIAKILRNAIDKSYLRCVDQHLIREALYLMVYVRLNALWGYPGDTQEIFDKQRACARFQVEFRSRITVERHYVRGTNDTFDASGTYALQATPFLVTLESPNSSTGSGSVPWTQFSYHSTTVSPQNLDPPQITSSDGSDPLPGTLNVEVHLGWNMYLPAPGQVAATAPIGIDGILRFGFSNLDTAPSELYTSSCQQTCNGFVPHSERDNRWLWIFTRNHTEGGYMLEVPIRGLEQDGPRLVREAWHYDESTGTDRTIEDSSIALTHTPLAP